MEDEAHRNKNTKKSEYQSLTCPQLEDEERKLVWRARSGSATEFPTPKIPKVLDLWVMMYALIHHDSQPREMWGGGCTKFALYSFQCLCGSHALCLKCARRDEIAEWAGLNFACFSFFPTAKLGRICGITVHAHKITASYFSAAALDRIDWQALLCKPCSYVLEVSILKSAVAALIQDTSTCRPDLEL